MAKQNAKLTALGQNQSDTQASYLSSPLLTAPNTQIQSLSGANRQLRDPSKTLRPAMGIERIPVTAIYLSEQEKGSNGEQVWRIKGEDRIRLVGAWANQSTASGTSIVTTSTSAYVETTFYGTGLNILVAADSVEDVRATVDGGAEGGASIIPNQSLVIATRNYRTNIPFRATGTLALDNHTVKLRNNSGDFVFQGVEILCETSGIAIPQGEVISGGSKFVNATATTIAYGSGFDGNPTLNGRGGHVVIYGKDGYISKVIQQTDAAQANLTSANHTNEEVSRNYFFREFGAARADDFSGALGDSQFTLEDGTTTLWCDNLSISGSADRLDFNANADYVEIGFMGTGLDIDRVDSANGGADTYSILVDGASIGNLDTTGSTVRRITKLVSGLPYGYHTVKILRVTAATWGLQIYNFITYVPKKPTIPDGAVAIGEYFLMSNYVASVSPGADNEGVGAGGVLRKTAAREMAFQGTWAVGINPLFNGGISVDSSTNGSFWEYTFFGTGLEIVARGSAAVTTSTIQIDGVAYTGAAIATGPSATWVGGTSTWTAATREGSRLQITGLTLAVHKIRITKTDAQQQRSMGVEVITPIHFPNVRCGSLGLNKNLVSFANQAEAGNIDLSKAKAWIVFDPVNNAIVNSYNVAACLNISTGLHNIWFQKPFRQANYVVMATATTNGATSLMTGPVAGQIFPSYCQLAVRSDSGALNNSTYLCASFFGTLQDEES